MFQTITGLLPSSDSNGDDGDDGSAKNPQMIADALVQDISEAYRETNFDMEDILGNMDEPGPFQNVFLQECETMNGLLGQMRHTLGELDAGFRGNDHVARYGEANDGSLFWCYTDCMASSAIRFPKSEAIRIMAQ